MPSAIVLSVCIVTIRPASSDLFAASAPFACTLSATVPPLSVTSAEMRFANASVVLIASANSTSPSSRSVRAAAPMPDSTASIGSGTPITPVEATATRFSEEMLAPAAASRCILAASSSPVTPVAAFALPELTTTAWMCARSQCSRQRSTGADWVPERVNRAALVVLWVSQTSRPRSGAPPSLIPHATPAARNPCGRPPPRVSIRCGGASIHRERKKPVAAVLTRSPPPPVARTSG